jgi:hypothetical protein
MAVPCFEHFIIVKYNVTCTEMPWNPINVYSFYVVKKRTERENSNILVEKNSNFLDKKRCSNILLAL